MALTEGMGPADIRAVMGNENNGFGNEGGWFWIVILFLFAFMRGGLWGGNGSGGNGGVTDGYVLASDFAQIERKLDTLQGGLCDGFYAVNTSFGNLNNTLATNFASVQNTLTQGFAGLNTGMIQGLNSIGQQMSNCCCDIREGIAGVNYNMATQANSLSREVERGFCDTQYRDAMNTNSLMQSGHSDADRIIAKLDAMETARKDETIARQNQELFQWQLRSSQSDQTATLLRELGYHCPQPAYVVQPPQQVTFPTNCCGGVNYASGGCGCGG